MSEVVVRLFRFVVSSSSSVQTERIISVVSDVDIERMRVNKIMLICTYMVDVLQPFHPYTFWQGNIENSQKP